MNSTKNFTTGESLLEQCQVEVEGPQVVNSFFQKNEWQYVKYNYIVPNTWGISY